MLVRAASALIGVLALVGVWYFFSVTGLLVACAIVTGLSCIEFSRMVEQRSRLVQSLFVVVSFAFYLTFSFQSQSFLVFLSFFVLLVTYFMLFTKDTIERRVNGLASWTVGVLYCSIFTGVISLGLLKFGSPYFLAVLLVSFVTDTLAYLGGRAFGCHPLAPEISPKKTLEGALVGLVGGSLVAGLYMKGSPHSSPLWLVGIVALAGSLFSQVGDLFESMIKRHSGVKDSGNLMPGHGGLLDRIDGVLFAAPVIYIWMDFYLNS